MKELSMLLVFFVILDAIPFEKWHNQIIPIIYAVWAIMWFICSPFLSFEGYTNKIRKCKQNLHFILKFTCKEQEPCMEVIKQKIQNMCESLLSI